MLQPSLFRGMSGNSQSVSAVIRFGPFDADLQTQELRKHGVRLRLPRQSFQILKMLLERPGSLITREELRQVLWPSDTFVDFDHSLNAAVNRLREALGDSADEPRLVETLPRRGYRFIGEITETPKNEALHATAAEDSIPSGRVETSTPSPRRFVVIGILCAGAILGLAAFGIARWRSKHAEVPRFTALPFTSLPGDEVAPAFSPDGSRIAFAWDGGPDAGGKGADLYVKAIGSETQLRLTQHPSGWLSSAWSPDGTQIAFHRLAGSDTGVYVVPALGGPERKLTSTRMPRGAGAGISWSPDGKWIAFADELPNEPTLPMFLVSVETLEVRPLPYDASCLAEANPTFSHDGKRIFFLCVHSPTSIEIDAMPAAGGASTVVLPPQRLIMGFALSGDDSRIVFSHDYGLKLSMLSINDHSVSRIESPDWAFGPALSPNGDKLAYSAEFQAVSIWRRDLLHPEISAIPFIPSTRPQNYPRYSPDGKHIAFESKRGGPWALWVSDADGGNLAQMSKDVLGSMALRWSPDGKKIAFDTAWTTPSAIYIVDIAEGVPRKLHADVDDIKLPAWSRDGKWIYFTADVSRGHKIYRVPAEGGKAEQLPSGESAVCPAESADGVYLYFASREENFELEKVKLAGLKREIQKEAIPRVMVWHLWEIAPGGIYFVPSGSSSMQYFDLASHRVKEMFRLDKDFHDGFSVSPDGRYMLYSQLDEENSDIMVMNKYH
jgi:Tol biopolymer transport system component/DNA-binding winged helix-turn-helix (wHTH) protein